MNNRKVDVVVNVYGKPFQTIATLRTLFHHSGAYIDKCFIIFERMQPIRFDFTEMLRMIPRSCGFIPSNYKFQYSHVDLDNDAERLSVRYQFAFEHGANRHLFITHNDVLYTENIVLKYLNLIGDGVGVGQIGQCWNCPANASDICSGENFGRWIPSLKEVLSLPLPFARTNLGNINERNPFPLPECRLNEWACLVDRQISNEETIIRRRVPLFGLADGVDIGTSWFSGMHGLGYQFVHSVGGYDHGYWANTTAGHGADKDKSLYDFGEQRAKDFIENGQRWLAKAEHVRSQY